MALAPLPAYFLISEVGADPLGQRVEDSADHLVNWKELVDVRGSENCWQPIVFAAKVYIFIINNNDLYVPTGSRK